MSKFAAHDEFSIYAVADTAEAAIAQAQVDAMDLLAEFEADQIDDTLAAYVEENGWNGCARCFEVRNGFIVDTTSR